MVKFGDYVFPHVLNVKKQTSRIFYEVPLPGRAFAYRKDRGGKGLTFVLDGYLRPSSQVEEGEIQALSDGTPRIFDLELAGYSPIESVITQFSTDNQVNETEFLNAGSLILFQGEEVGLNKSVTASGEEGGKEADHVNDGLLDTRWYSAGDAPYWVRMDLATVLAIGRMRIRWESTRPWIWKIQYSDDDGEWHDVLDFYDSPGYENAWSGYPIGDLSHRYWRIYSTSDRQSIWEWQLYKAQQYLFLGHRQKFNKINFTLSTPGNAGAPLFEYSKGDGTWGDLSKLYDDFTGTVLNDNLWSLTKGSCTITNGIASIGDPDEDSEILSELSLEPYHRMIFQVTPKQTNKNCAVHPLYLDGNHNIRVEFKDDGHMAIVAVDESGYSYDIGETYTADVPVTIMVMWTPSAIKLYVNNKFTLMYVTTHIPTIAGPFKITANTGGYMEVDYVRYLYDATYGLTQSGVVEFEPPLDWRLDFVKSLERFWVRMTADALAVNPVASSIGVNEIYNCLMLDPQFQESAQEYNRTDYTLTFQQQENP